MKPNRLKILDVIILKRKINEERKKDRKQSHYWKLDNEN